MSRFRLFFRLENRSLFCELLCYFVVKKMNFSFIDEKVK